MEQKNITMIISGIVAVLIIIGGLIWWNMSSPPLTVNEPIKNATTTTTKTTQVNENELVEKAYTQTRVKEGGVYITTVNFTDEGFTPPIIYINRGESVRFVNKADASMRVVSNDFQGAPLYSGFGEQNSVSKGGKYEFTFTKAGVWGYHNLNGKQYFYGIINVR